MNQQNMFKDWINSPNHLVIYVAQNIITYGRIYFMQDDMKSIRMFFDAI